MHDTKTTASWQRAHAGIGHGVDTIDTPSLVIDLDAMERNLARMAAFAREHGMRLRPHAKMHKSAELARLQMAHGAVGVCVQKTDEALALAHAAAGKGDEAIDLLHRALRANPRDRDAVLQLSNLHIEQQKFADMDAHQRALLRAHAAHHRDGGQMPRRMLARRHRDGNRGEDH